MTDIVERLHKAGVRDGFAVILKQHVDEAADEIERLRAERDEMAHRSDRLPFMLDEIERLREQVRNRDYALDRLGRWLAAEDMREIGRRALELKP